MKVGYARVIFRSDDQFLQKWRSAGVPSGTPHGCIHCDDSLGPRVSPAKQGMLMSVSERFFW